MKKLVLLLTTAYFLMVSCQSEPRYLSQEQIDKEKKAVIETIKAYNRAAERKNFTEMVETLAGEVKFFGTDSGEVISSFAEYKDKMTAQWKEYDIMKYGDLTDVYIEVDPNANLASIVFGIPLYVKKANFEATYFLRVARTLKKENNKWAIVSGISSIPRTNIQETVAPILPGTDSVIKERF